MRFGLWVEGSSVVVEMADGPSAFRREERLRLQAVRVHVMVLRADGRWSPVPPSSPLRPAPAPPAGPRRVPWWDRRARGGYWLGWLGSRWARKAPWFGRGGDKSG